MSDESLVEVASRAAKLVEEADALIIGAGAGMGVDSGLPDFRGDHGFWRAYPLYQKLGYRFTELANPRWFRDDPAIAWGFYGHRFNLYRRTTPHAGFQILRKWSRAKSLGSFVFTSNVDGQFQAAGFDPGRIIECHGAIGNLQCFSECGGSVFSADFDRVDVDQSTMRARDPLPSCPECGGLARPNILMFGDWGWDESITSDQRETFVEWAKDVRGSRVVVIECGAGVAIPTVRHFCQSMAGSFGGRLVRINPIDAKAPPPGLEMPMGALSALEAIDARLATEF